MKKPHATLDEDVQRDWMRAQLEKDVADMRRLGVASWRDIVLGSAPGEERKPMTQAELKEREIAKAARMRDVMFAATHVKPTFSPNGEDQ